ncbi:MAG: RodZ domain-containing protein [Candidatus Planktophila sp.]
MALGENLRRARENAGLSLDELARITNLRTGLISMMESGDFSQCGGDTYARGHIRNISRALGVSADDFLSTYDSEHSSDVRSIHAQLVDNNAAAIRSENRKLSWKVLIGVSVSIVVLIGVAQFALSAIDTETATTSVVTEVKPSTEPTAEVMPTASPSTSTEVVIPSGDKLNLVISATRGNSNIDVVVGGVHLYKGPLFQGEEKSFVGDVSISVYLGNAGDLDLTLNGEKLAPLGERNQEIRKTFRAK